MAASRYRATAALTANHVRRFKTRGGAERYLEKIEARLTEANKLADGEIWTSIDIIYQCRWDCSTARLAAAH